MRFFGCHSPKSTNFDAGIQVCGGGKYNLFLNGKGVIESDWKQSDYPFSASGSYVMSVELIWQSQTSGMVKVELSDTNGGSVQSLEANLVRWTDLINGVAFWKELTLATGANEIAELWSTPEFIEKTQKIYMSTLAFNGVRLLRHSGGETEYSLSDYCETTLPIPRLAPEDKGTMPTWAQMRYGCNSPGYGPTNYFSIDCRPV